MCDICMFFFTLAQLDGELRQVLKIRRENIYTATGEQEVMSNHWKKPTHAQYSGLQSVELWGMYT